MQKNEWAGFGYAPHKTPSGAFDPEIFAPPSISEIPNIDEMNEINLRTESLGLKCLGNRPLLVPQLSTDSVFSREEGETIDEIRTEDLGLITPKPSLPIGIRKKTSSNDEVHGSSVPAMYLSPDCGSVDDPASVVSLPDRLCHNIGCEEMANAMSMMVLNDEKECLDEQIKTNNLYQQICLANPIDEMTTEQINVLYKTELCRSWQFGQCKYKERCLFAHGENELKPLKRARHNKYKTELCLTFHSFGFCPYGIRCNFVHEMDEHRPAKHSVPSLYKTRLCRTFMEKNVCPYGDKCDFAHGTSDLSYDITKHPKYRTKLCRSFLESGTCVYGDRCCFSHSLPKKKEKVEVEQTAKFTQTTEPIEPTDETPTKKVVEKTKQTCRRWKYSGKCSFGDQCIYYHGTPGKRSAKRG